MNFFIKIYDDLTIFLSQIKSLLTNLYSFLFIRIFFFFIFLINILLWLGAYLMYKKIGQSIAVLHYNVDFGIDLIDNKSYFFVIPLLGLFFILFNITILLILVKKDDFKFLAYFLLSFLSLFNILLIFSLFSIYLINF